MFRRYSTKLPHFSLIWEKTCPIKAFLCLIGQYTKTISSFETTVPIGTKLYMNDVWKVLYWDFIVTFTKFSYISMTIRLNGRGQSRQLLQHHWRSPPAMEVDIRAQTCVGGGSYRPVIRSLWPYYMATQLPYYNEKYNVQMNSCTRDQQIDKHYCYYSEINVYIEYFY